MPNKSMSCLFTIIAMATTLVGCDREERWEISAENLSNNRCRITIHMNGGSSQCEIDLINGEMHVLQAGDVEVLIDTVDVEQAGTKQTIAINKHLRPMWRFIVEVQADGVVRTTWFPLGLE